MSIVKMKHLRALGMRGNRSQLLRRLRSLGCVEIDTPEELPPEWDFLVPTNSHRLARYLDEADELSSALTYLKPYAQDKSGLLTPRPQVAEDTLFDETAYRAALDVARDVNDAQTHLNAYQAQRAKLDTQLHALEPWLDLPVPLDLADTKDTDLFFSSAPLSIPREAVAAKLDGATDLYDLTWAGEDREFRYFLVVAHKSVSADVQAALLDLGCARLNLRNWTGTAAENYRSLQAKRKELDEWTEGSTGDIAENGDRAFDLKVALDKVHQEIELERTRERLMTTERTFLLEGWFPAEKEQAVRAVLDEHGLAYDIADPAPEEYPKVPVQLKNNRLTAPFNAITEMYSMPAYDSVDPNPLMAPFFIFFFGFMMNDIGYGLLMVLGTALFLWKARPKGNMRNMMAMFFYCGIASIFWGCLTGSFLGDFLPKLFQLTGASVPGYYDASGAFVWFWKPLFTPINDIILVMIGSMVLGVIQVFTGMAVSVREKFRHGQALDAVTQEIAWYGILIGAALTIAGPMLGGQALGTVGLVILVVGVVLLPTGSILRSKSALGAITWIWDAYQSISGYFSDILSYLRLMALMMAGSIIASVFNTLGSVFGLVPFIIVALIGNVLNLVLNLLGCYVHTMRLQCLEFFGRFYQDGGKAFRPLTVETKYVDILKEEM